MGHVVYLPTQYTADYGEWYEFSKNAKANIDNVRNSIKNHMMDAVKKALRQKGYK